jgi:hypothetical protein
MDDFRSKKKKKRVDTEVSAVYFPNDSI